MANEISNYSEETKKRKQQYPAQTEPTVQGEVQPAITPQAQNNGVASVPQQQQQTSGAPVDMRSDRPEDTSPPGETVPLATTVTPIENGEDPLIGGTPISATYPNRAQTIQRRSDNPEDTTPPEGYGNLVTTVRPIEDGEQQLTGGTPVVNTQREGEQTAVSAISATTDTNSGGAVAPAEEKKASAPIGFVDKDGKEYWYEPSGIDGADTIHTVSRGGKTYTVWGNNKNQIYTKDGRIATRLTSPDNLAIAKDAASPSATSSMSTSTTSETSVPAKAESVTTEKKEPSATTTGTKDGVSSDNAGGSTTTGKVWGAPGQRVGATESGSVRLQSPWRGSSIDNLRLNPDDAQTEPAKEKQPPKKEKRRFSKAQQARKDAAAKEMKENYKGNVDLTNRPSVDSATMKKAGYDIPDGQHATVYSSQSAFYDKSKGGEREILYTPILPDGTVMSQKDVDEYLKGLGEKGDIMELDKPENGGKGIVIGADYEPSDGPGARLHELQEEYYSSPEDYKAKADEARKKIRESYGGGNLDPLSVKPVSKEEMEKAGWNSPLYGDMVRAHPVRQTIVDGDGNKHIVVMSPIRKDGEIIPADEFEDYVEALQSSDDIMGDDRDGYRLIIKYDASPGDEDNLFYSLPDADLDASDDEEEEPTGEVKEYSYTNDYTDETDRMLAERIKEIEDRNAKYAEYMKDPNNSLRSVIEKAAQDQLKEEGLDSESEERLKRRRRTSGIIANIGDILQGFANMVGAWYGANSAKLSSLSAAAREGSEKQDAARQKRRDEIMKNRESALLRVEKDLDKTMQEYIKELDRANNNRLNYRMFTGKEAQRAKNREERDQRQFERNKILNKTKEKNWAKRQDRLQKDRKEMEGIRQANRLQARGYSAQKAIEVKQSPTWSQTHPKSSSSGGKGSKKSGKKGSHKSGNKRQRRSQGSLNE